MMHLILPISFAKNPIYFSYSGHYFCNAVYMALHTQHITVFKVNAGLLRKNYPSRNIITVSADQAAAIGMLFDVFAQQDVESFYKAIEQLLEVN